MGESVIEEWIRSQYGPILVREDSGFGIVVAAVPVYRGVALGIGRTKDKAMKALQRDLQGDLKAATN